MCADILLAEDDRKQADLVRLYLEREQHTVTTVPDGREALAHLRAHPPDLVILDIMLPGMTGLEVCRVLRRESALPVLMLTARSTEDDLIHGLDQGADDYLTKPYSPRELMARVRTLLRRTRAPGATGPLRVGGLVIDSVRHEVTVDGRRIETTPGEFRLLEVMAAHPYQVFTRGQLLERLHGFDRYITQRAIDMHVMNLRKKIEPSPRRPERLRTVYGVGYKLTAPDAP
ncbi:response regulator transcription factor [Amycolatopsis jiangsuensis]|uniref:DNA-binding response OmpR family regulator n=1 Tax=Amycolatopsis jiangsuensis TaxID=1181879 RepID=A0A840J1A6_9PSEU|nr:response regulator transcription factor [Amycolatopsis jiangsuensis]MBB4688871.1 DNA-binding response OmpR family regulator [Amycolatopsis jiangsuensis]